MKIKQSQLIQIIETVVRECIAEKKAQFAKQRISEAGLTSEKADDKITALDDIVKFVASKAGKKGLKDKAHFAYLTKALFKHQMGMEPDDDAVNAAIDSHLGNKKIGDVEEASYKKVAPNAVDCVAADKARTIQTDPEVNEASFKVAAPHSVDTAKEDKARTIQTDPKVNETAFKKQGPSLKTFKDSPQFPEAVNDPENR